VSSESAQVGRVLHAQDIRHVNAGVCHDRIRRVLGPVKTIDLCGILQEERKTTRAIPVQRDIKETNGVL